MQIKLGKPTYDGISVKVYCINESGSELNIKFEPDEVIFEQG